MYIYIYRGFGSLYFMKPEKNNMKSPANPAWSKGIIAFTYACGMWYKERLVFKPLLLGYIDKRIIDIIALSPNLFDIFALPLPFLSVKKYSKFFNIPQHYYDDFRELKVTLHWCAFFEKPKKNLENWRKKKSNLVPLGAFFRICSTFSFSKSSYYIDHFF